MSPRPNRPNRPYARPSRNWSHAELAFYFAAAGVVILAIFSGWEKFHDYFEIVELFAAALFVVALYHFLKAFALRADERDDD